ncbi:MAG: hypothetical protein KGS48_16630, partial [Bacteroidetes bacterium]|nr:hypothetical protein [Bacteroidota bacterium]
FSIFSIALNQLNGQITLTNSSFPVLGDTLKYASDNNPPASINPFTPPGGNQIWDFSALHADNTQTIVFRAPGSGQHAGDFTNANLAVLSNGTEAYYKTTNTAFQLLGYAGPDPVKLGIQSVVKFLPPQTERRAPTNFFDINNSSNNLILTFPTTQPPLDSIFSGSPLNVDSLRIRIYSSRTEVVDAWGYCLIPGGGYQVLRQKRTEYKITNMDVFLNIGGINMWVDLTTLIGGSTGLGSLLGTDTIITYHFLSDMAKEEIAVMELNQDQNGVRLAQFKNLVALSNLEPFADENRLSLNVFPNPASEWVQVDCPDFPQDGYTLVLFDGFGHVVESQSHSGLSQGPLRLGMERFSQGMYEFVLLDGKGKLIGSKRFLVLRH